MITFKYVSEICDTISVCYGQYDESNIQPDGNVLVPIIVVYKHGLNYSWDQKLAYLEMKDLEEITSEQLQKVADTIYQVFVKQSEIDKLLSSLLS